MSTTLTVSGVSLEIEQRGAGRPLLFLHPARVCSRAAPGSTGWRRASG